MFIALSLLTNCVSLADNTYNESIMVGTQKRSYIIHIPPSYTKAIHTPLLLVLHGGGATAYSMVNLTHGEFNLLSDKEGFIVVYPVGINKYWHDGRGNKAAHYQKDTKDIDDTGFISTLIDNLLFKYNLDSSQVFITGMSNGAIMTYRLGCELSRKIAAIAPVDGNISKNIISSCIPVNPVSVLSINSTKDPLVPWNGGMVTGPFGRKKFGEVLSVNQSIEFWVKNNECNSIPIITKLPDTDPNDGSIVKRFVYHSDKKGTDVVLYAIEGGGHTWPEGKQYLPVEIIGHTCNDFDATYVIWEFFKAHPKR